MYFHYIAIRQPMEKIGTLNKLNHFCHKDPKFDWKCGPGPVIHEKDLEMCLCIYTLTLLCSL